MTLQAFKPIGVVGPTGRGLIKVFLIVFFLLLWQFQPYAVIPKPIEVLRMFPVLLTERELLPNLMVSLQTNVEALIIATSISLSLSYLSVVPVIRPLTAALANTRYLGFYGMTLPVQLVFGTQHRIKVALLVIGVVGFFLGSMYNDVQNIPENRFNYSRTLGTGNWRVVWLTVVRGTLPQAWDAFRLNAAMGWLILSTVESMYRSEGGLGAMLANEQKHLDYAAIFAVQITVFLVGFGQDRLIVFLKKLTCPYAADAMNRRNS